MILGKNLKFLSCLLSFEKSLDMYFYNFFSFIKKKSFLAIKMPFSDSRKICIFSYFSFFQRFPMILVKNVKFRFSLLFF